MMRRFLLSLYLVIGSLFAGTAYAEGCSSSLAESVCPEADIWGDIFSGVCWDCFLPIYLGEFRLVKGENERPSEAADDFICLCDECIGIVLSMYHPSKLHESVAGIPYCYPTLSGDDSGSGETSEDGSCEGSETGANDGSSGDSAEADELSEYRWTTSKENKGNVSGAAQMATYYVHYYFFALAEILELVADCGPATNAIELTAATEVWPHWLDDEMSLFVNPEVVIFSTVGVLAQFADCPAATFSTPIDTLYWVQGCWGLTYPLTGFVTSSGSMPADAALAAARFNFTMYRLMMRERYVGDDNVCDGGYEPLMHKSEHKFQQFWPVRESDSMGYEYNCESGSADSCTDITGGLSIQGFNDVCCHEYGSNPFAWGEWRNRVGAEAYINIEWQWVDCCVKVYCW